MTSAALTMPNRVRNLPRNRAGYPVPWFVATVDGEPDFRVIAPGRIERAFAGRLCWICGQKIRGDTFTFVIGPMCAVNRVSAEPPSHRDCAIYSARACPFLANPKKRRREGNKPEEAVNPAGEMITRNPGVALVWTTKRPAVRSDGHGGMLFDVGDPCEALWFAEGREATRAEVLESIDSGLPILREMAEHDGDAALAYLSRLHERALTFVPAEVEVAS